ncbi:hypothetical protein C8T65DRAFT_627514 [Cerioporus squamosus]|nr:hypothetical protein C8T65DRAFT_627514 [Cerioporus squamosus]
MYDYPSSTSSSTLPSPLSPRRHHHKRSQSPLPHLATLLPANNHHHHHHQYSPSSRAADISRLLDPAYASSSSSSSMCPTPSPQTQTRAYVDHNGDLHDPDYRDFPVLRPTSRASDNQKRRRTSASSAARSRSHDRYSIAMHPSRPNWERDWGTEVDSDEEIDDDETESQSHFSPFASQHGSPRKHTSHSAFGRSTTFTSTYYYFDAPPTTSPMGSYEDESPNALQLHESPFDDEAAAEEVIEESRKTACLIRKASKPRKSVEVEVEKVAEEPSPISIDEEQYEDEHGSTPTCSHVLRQQWQAVTLRIRFGVFHAKRRLFTRRRRT